mmetsp:Transcript_26787/g.58244  ORF Transcript_26787/g.58244 Transcript_26787/m.58244 type:complete len:385 (+) Transcript_26787:766-1920(+)
MGLWTKGEAVLLIEPLQEGQDLLLHVVLLQHGGNTREDDGAILRRNVLAVRIRHARTCSRGSGLVQCSNCRVTRPASPLAASVGAHGVVGNLRGGIGVGLSADVAQRSEVWGRLGRPRRPVHLQDLAVERGTEFAGPFLAAVAFDHKPGVVGIFEDDSGFVGRLSAHDLLLQNPNRFDLGSLTFGQLPYSIDLLLHLDFDIFWVQLWQVFHLHVRSATSTAPDGKSGQRGGVRIAILLVFIFDVTPPRAVFGAFSARLLLLDLSLLRAGALAGGGTLQGFHLRVQDASRDVHVAQRGRPFQTFLLLLAALLEPGGARSFWSAGGCGWGWRHGGASPGGSCRTAANASMQFLGLRLDSGFHGALACGLHMHRRRRVMFGLMVQMF